jgi:hypothetical protein
MNCVWGADGIGITEVPQAQMPVVAINIAFLIITVTVITV